MTGPAGSRGLSVADLASRVGAEVLDASAHGQLVRGVATLERATRDDVSFLDNTHYLASLAGSAAGACLMRHEHADRAPVGMAILATVAPYLAWARTVAVFHTPPSLVPGIDPSARVAADARVGQGSRVEAGAVIGQGVALGERCLVGANTVIGDGVEIGDETRIGANASLAHCRVGARCLIYPGVRVGTDGFGFAIDGERYVRVPHIGRVLIGDDVEVGSNSTIDRGTLDDTVIGAGTMIDNLVQIAHNVVIGRGCVIAGQVGISGSARLGDFVVVGGQAGIAGHLIVGSRVRIASRSAVKDDLDDGQAYGGAPAVPIREFRRQIAAVMRLGKRKSGQP
ncbi:MAG: UDP-3-O-(3-hydroxymyristoyl)glucosamine N-acyltransferase [Alphaproteobacteria bacterium]|nr:UDP-3-O-(3-hydroxymyristoyl)glucosamine N-acyltransferase [Alphaproteobacteria bacterium]